MDGLKSTCRLLLLGIIWLAAILAVSGAILFLAILAAGHVEKVVTDPDISGWAQAIGAVLAIVVGFAGTAFQLQAQKNSERIKEKAAARAAYLLAFDALNTVSDRLSSALTPNRDKKTHAIRGKRTTEMVTAMREFDTSRMPDNMLANFIRLRSRVFAINERITEIYASEDRLTGNELASEKARRYEHLRSSVLVRGEAVELFLELANTAIFENGASFETLSAHANIDEYPLLPE